MTGPLPALRALLVAAALAAPLAVGVTADAAGMLAAPNGMTLYVYDSDKGGKPTCNGFCAVAWPPFVANGEKLGRGWTTVARANGQQQWAYDGHPVYFYSGDHAKGDAKGNGMEGVWHIVAG